MDGGISSGKPSGNVSAAETSGLPHQEGGAGRGHNRLSDEERQDQTDGRGSSDRGDSGTTDGLRAKVAQGTETDDSGDREKSGDLIFIPAYKAILFKPSIFERAAFDSLLVDISTIQRDNIK